MKPFCTVFPPHPIPPPPDITVQSLTNWCAVHPWPEVTKASTLKQQMASSPLPNSTRFLIETQTKPTSSWPWVGENKPNELQHSHLHRENTTDDHDKSEGEKMRKKLHCQHDQAQLETENSVKAFSTQQSLVNSVKAFSTQLNLVNSIKAFSTQQNLVNSSHSPHNRTWWTQLRHSPHNRAWWTQLRHSPHNWTWWTQGSLYTTESGELFFFSSNFLFPSTFQHQRTTLVLVYYTQQLKQNKNLIQKTILKRGEREREKRKKRSQSQYKLQV